MGDNIGFSDGSELGPEHVERVRKMFENRQEPEISVNGRDVGHGADGMAEALQEMTGISIEEMMEALRPEILFKKAESAPTPDYATKGSAGFDIATNEFCRIRPDDYKLVDTGLIIQTPEDFYLRITGRSSTPRKWGVHIIEGVIDSDYCGDEDWLKLQVWNPSRNTVEIPRGTRIAQGIFIPILRPKFVETTTMGESRGGFGSTG